MYTESNAQPPNYRDPDASQRAAEAELGLEHLRRQVNHLAVLCESLWNLLKEKQGYSDEDLMLKVLEVQKNECRPDGTKKVPGLRHCPQCQRVLQRFQNVCSYCGHGLPPALFD